MNARQLTTGITLLILVGILTVGFFYGLDKFLEPIGEDPPTAAPTTSCSTVEKGQRLRSRQVVVNVLNGGTRAGLAGSTLNSLARRGFQPGEVGNAPSNRVQRVQVWITNGEKSAGRLVALNFGPRTPVVKRKDVVEGGVDVVVADGFVELAERRKTIRVRKALEVCPPSVAAEVG